MRPNGVVTPPLRDEKFASGPPALRYGPGAQGAMSGPIKGRKVQVRPLTRGAPQAPRPYRPTQPPLTGNTWPTKQAAASLHR